MSSEIDWLATIRGRLGYAITPDLLIFGTAGVAFAEVEQELTFQISQPGAVGVAGFVQPGAQLLCDINTTCLNGRSSEWQTGWTAGGGFELALSSTLSLKAEYLYTDLGSSSVVARPSRITALGSSSSSVFLAAETEFALQVGRIGISVDF